MTEILVRTPGPEDRRIAITQLVIAGWTGRDKVAMEHHMAELEALGVARPARTPIFYRAAAARPGARDRGRRRRLERRGRVRARGERWRALRRCRLGPYR